MLVGAHVSVAKGLIASLEYARDVGCECIQVFAKSPRRWVGPPPDIEAGLRFAEARESHGIRAVYTHTAYLINLAATDPEARARSIEALADEIVRGRLLSAEGVITHLGTDPLGDPEGAAERIAMAVRDAFDIADDAGPGPDDTDRRRTRLLLENSAGAGHTYGRDVEQLATVFDAAPELRESLGVCVDTCHGHVAGMGLGTPEEWTTLIESIDTRCRPGALEVVHANDAVYGGGSRRDRHAWIGDGTLGHEPFAAMFTVLAGTGTCAITEMPGEVPVKDSENIRRLKGLRAQVAQ